jgi:hypothetical protein
MIKFYDKGERQEGFHLQKNDMTGEYKVSICQEDEETSKLSEVGKIVSVEELKKFRDVLLSEVGDDAFEEVMEKLENTQKTERFLEDSIVQYLEDKDKGVLEENFLKDVLEKFREMKIEGRDVGGMGNE